MRARNRTATGARRLASQCAAIALLVVVLAGAATAAGPTTERVSISTAGAEANAASASPAMSADGRFVAFSSAASNLVAGDTNDQADVFVRDRETGTTELVSGGETLVANGASFRPAISADGRFVAFASFASNLAPGDSDALADVFVVDRTSNEIVRIRAGAASPGPYTVDVSDDGRFVVFDSDANDLIAGDSNGTRDAFLWDRSTGTTVRVSVSSAAAEANAASQRPRISGNGGRIVFESLASNLVADDTNGTQDAFVRDVGAGNTSRASVTSAEGEANGFSGNPAISADGSVVTFASAASNLVPFDANAATDVFLRDLSGGDTELESVNSAGVQGNALTDESSPSSDGRFVAMTSIASNLVAYDDNGVRDAFVRDRETGEIRLVSVGPFYEPANGMSFEAVPTDDGNLVAFASRASNLVSGDTNSADDIFLRDDTPTPPPANDNFADRQSLTGETGNVEGSNDGATKEAGEPDHAGNPGGASIWYRWTAPTSGPAMFDTCGSDFDTVLAVYTGSSVGALTPVASNDDACGFGSRVGFTAVAGAEYEIAVDGFYGDHGHVVLAWSRTELQFPPLEQSPPAISGQPKDGETLTATTGVWLGTQPMTFSFSWLRCDPFGASCTTIGGATAQTRTLTSADIGSRLRVLVTATNAAGSDYAASALTGIVTAAAPAVVSPPTIEGVPLTDEVLAASPGGWRGTNPSFAYQWQRCNAVGEGCVDLAGENTEELVLTPAHVGFRIRVVVTATNVAGSALAASAPTDVVRRRLAPVRCVVPSVRGKTVRVARRMLGRRHCRLGKVGRVFSRRVRKGIVISQRPRAGTRRPNGAKVNLVVSRGRRR